MQDICLCFKNVENMDMVDQVNKSHFYNTLTECLFNVSQQLNSTFSTLDKSDHIKDFFNDDVNKEIMTSDFFDMNIFKEFLIIELNKLYIEFLGVDVLNKKYVFDNFDLDEQFSKVFYAMYLSVAVKQSLIVKVLYNIFSNLNSNQIHKLENILGRSIEKEHISNKEAKKLNLRSTNYILDLNSIIKTNEDLSKIILNTNLFRKHLDNTMYYSDEIPTNYTYEVLFKEASDYEIEMLFNSLFKSEDNIQICINNIQVYGIQHSFEIFRYGD